MTHVQSRHQINPGMGRAGTAPPKTLGWNRDEPNTVAIHLVRGHVGIQKYSWPLKHTLCKQTIILGWILDEPITVAIHYVQGQATQADPKYQTML